MPPYENPFDDYGYLLQLVEFAIRKEEEAAAFYNSLALRAVTGSTAAEFRQLAAMEEGHRSRLETLNVAEAASMGPPEVGSLKIADYEVEVQARPEMSRQELLDMAIRREIASIRLYSDMAGLVPESSLKQLLQNLAGEEEMHRQRLDGIRAKGF